jgi:hypothetical protein
VLYGEAIDAREAGELEHLEYLDPEDVMVTATRTVDMFMMVDATYDAHTMGLSDFELVSSTEN